MSSPIAIEAGTGGDRRRWLAMPFIALGVAMIIIDDTIVNVAVPSIIRDLHTTAATAEWAGRHVRSPAPVYGRPPACPTRAADQRRRQQARPQDRDGARLDKPGLYHLRRRAHQVVETRRNGPPAIDTIDARKLQAPQRQRSATRSRLADVAPTYRLRS